MKLIEKKDEFIALKNVGDGTYFLAEGDDSLKIHIKVKREGDTIFCIGLITETAIEQYFSPNKRVIPLDITEIVYERKKY